MCVCACVCVCVCVRVYVCACVHVCVRAYVYTRARARMCVIPYLAFDSARKLECGKFEAILPLVSAVVVFHREVFNSKLTIQYYQRMRILLWHGYD